MKLDAAAAPALRPRCASSSSPCTSGTNRASNRIQRHDRSSLLRPCQSTGEEGGPAEEELEGTRTNGTGAQRTASASASSSTVSTAWTPPSTGPQPPHAPPAPPPPAQTGSRRAQIAALKTRLLASLSSLDRGLAAKVSEAREVDTLASQLEVLGGTVRLHPRPSAGVDHAAASSTAPRGGEGGREAGGEGEAGGLPGLWRLVYTSGFNSGSLGGRRPGPPAALLPTTLGQVYQRIDARSGTLDNIVELLVNPGLPDLSALFGQPSSRQDSLGVRLTLRHDYEIQGSSTVQIVFQETSGELLGSPWLRSLPRLELPSLPEALRPPRFLRSAKFDVSFMDAGMRVTRGDRGELRVYLREDEGVAAGRSQPDEEEE